MRLRGGKMKINEMLGIIMMVVSLFRVAHVYRYGFGLRYRQWVKVTLMVIYGAMFALGVCLLI